MPAPPGPESCLLVIATARQGTASVTGPTYFSYLQLAVKGVDKRIEITSEHNAYCTDLPAGSHTTETIREQFVVPPGYEATIQPRPAVPFVVPFVLRARTITVFPVMFVLEINQTGGGVQYGWQPIELTDERKAEIISGLKKQPGFARWPNGAM